MRRRAAASWRRRWRWPGVAPRQLVALGWSDQEASLHIVEIATELARRLAGTDIVITHAYEGGHADHDTAALAVAAARRLLLRRGETAPDIIEVPLYRAGPEGRRLAQDFEPWPGAVATAVELLPEEQELKRAMFAAHATQRNVLTWFSVEAERFRVAAAI